MSDNLANVLNFGDYKNQNNSKIETQSDGLSTEEMFKIMFDKITSLEKQIEESKPKVKTKAKKQIDFTGEIQNVKEYSKFCFKDELQIEMIEKTLLKYINKNDAYKRSRVKLYVYYIMSLNLGLRVSDMLCLKFGNIIKSINLEKNEIIFRDEIGVNEDDGILETKTRNSRDIRKNRHVSINDTVKKSILFYLENYNDITLDDFIFQNDSVNSNLENKAMTLHAINKSLKAFDNRSGLCLGLNSHSLRRSFSWNYYNSHGNSHDSLLELQTILGHSSMAITMKYIGITKDMINEGYNTNNIGMKGLIEQ